MFELHRSKFWSWPCYKRGLSFKQISNELLLLRFQRKTQTYINIVNRIFQWFCLQNSRVWSILCFMELILCYHYLKIIGMRILWNIIWKRIVSVFSWSSKTSWPCLSTRPLCTNLSSKKGQIHIIIRIDLWIIRFLQPSCFLPIICKNVHPFSQVEPSLFTLNNFECWLRICESYLWGILQCQLWALRELPETFGIFFHE